MEVCCINEKGKSCNTDYCTCHSSSNVYALFTISPLDNTLNDIKRSHLPFSEEADLMIILRIMHPIERKT